MKKIVMQSSLILVGLSIASAASARRGNDFGNGGDPIREVFNAGRVFAIDLLDGTKNAALVQELSGEQRELLNRLAIRAANHLRNSEHQWGDWQQASCARTSIANKHIVTLAYDVCSKATRNAAHATEVLLEIALRSDAAVGDLASAKILADDLVNVWKVKNPESFAKAESFTLSRGTVGGRWSCLEIASGQKMQLEVSDEGLVRAPVTLLSSVILSDVIEFTSFLNLTKDRDQFRAVGQLKRPRPNASAHDNVIFLQTCDYPFAVELVPEANDQKLTVRVDMNGSPTIPEACGPLLPTARQLTCVRKN